MKIDFIFLHKERSARKLPSKMDGTSFCVLLNRLPDWTPLEINDSAAGKLTRRYAHRSRSLGKSKSTIIPLFLSWNPLCEKKRQCSCEPFPKTRINLLFPSRDQHDIESWKVDESRGSLFQIIMYAIKKATSKWSCFFWVGKTGRSTSARKPLYFNILSYFFLNKLPDFMFYKKQHNE